MVRKNKETRYKKSERKARREKARESNANMTQERQSVAKSEMGGGGERKVGK
jgi:hypothetical protein